MAELSSLSFWRLFHSSLRHGNGEEESVRAKEVYEWTIDNTTDLRKCCVDYELDLIGAILDLSRTTETLPSYDLVKEKVNTLEKNEGAVEALKEYESLRDTQLNIHHKPELEAVFLEFKQEFEKLKLRSFLKKALLIVDGSVENKTGKNRAKLSGARDAQNYLMGKFEEGILVGDRQGSVNRPLIVQSEAEEIGATYDRRLKRGFVDTGFAQVRLFPSNFVGILGYANHGKSSVARFMLYSMALSGKNACHISLENDQEVEFEKFVLLHAHNKEIFGDDFRSLSYENFINGTLTKEQRGWLDYVGKDFKKNVGGRIVIRQPQEATWSSCKAIIEQENRRVPLEVVCIDYPQLLEPVASNSEERKVKLNADIKDMRQYALHFDGDRKLIILAPAQGNEEGRSEADSHDGIWQLSGINNEKELSRSMDIILGVFPKEQVNTTHGSERLVTISCVKDRDRPMFLPFTARMTGCGMFSSGAVVSSVKIAPPSEKDMIGGDIL